MNFASIHCVSPRDYRRDNLVTFEDSMTMVVRKSETDKKIRVKVILTYFCLAVLPVLLIVYNTELTQ